MEGWECWGKGRKSSEESLETAEDAKGKRGKDALKTRQVVDKRPEGSGWKCWESEVLQPFDDAENLVGLEAF